MLAEFSDEVRLTVVAAWEEMELEREWGFFTERAAWLEEPAVEWNMRPAQGMIRGAFSWSRRPPFRTSRRRSACRRSVRGGEEGPACVRRDQQNARPVARETAFRWPATESESGSTMGDGVGIARDGCPLIAAPLACRSRDAARCDAISPYKMSAPALFGSQKDATKKRPESRLQCAPVGTVRPETLANSLSSYHATINNPLPTIRTPLRW